MIIFVLAVSILIGLLVAEISLRAFAAARVSARMREIGTIFRSFHQSDSDEVRQALLMRSGVRTLLFSLGALILLLVLAVIACLPQWLMNCDESQQIVYFLALSVSSTWWWIRRRP